MTTATKKPVRTPAQKAKKNADRREARAAATMAKLGFPDPAAAPTVDRVERERERNRRRAAAKKAEKKAAADLAQGETPKVDPHTEPPAAPVVYTTPAPAVAPATPPIVPAATPAAPAAEVDRLRAKLATTTTVLSEMCLQFAPYAGQQVWIGAETDWLERSQWWAAYEKDEVEP